MEIIGGLASGAGFRLAVPNWHPRQGASNVVPLTMLDAGAIGDNDEWIHAATLRAVRKVHAYAVGL